MRAGTFLLCALTACVLSFDAAAQTQTGAGPVATLSEVKRIYVAELKGAQGGQLRDLIIASLDATRMFALTDNPERADAVLKGAADDHAFTDSYDGSDAIGVRESGGKYGGGSFTKSGGGYLGLSLSESESQHVKERKHEAYASVRLCNKDGDVLWSTTQESLGAKFRGASADVATKVARQLTLDLQKARRSTSGQ